MFTFVLFIICSFALFALLFFTFVKPVEHLLPWKFMEDLKWEQLRRKENLSTFSQVQKAYESEQGKRSS